MALSATAVPARGPQSQSLVPPQIADLLARLVFTSRTSTQLITPACEPVPCARLPKREPCMHTQQARHDSASSPPLILDSAQLAPLNGAVRLAARSAPEIASRLLEEIDRAEVLPTKDVPDTVVTLGSWVTYQDVDNGSIRTLQLVLPSDADPTQQKFSIISPIGAALIGLSVGHVMPWNVRDGEQRRLTVIRVSKRPTAR